ncbi:MAG: DUF3800 domain-containing protein [Pseudomonadota bacterium]
MSFTIFCDEAGNSGANLLDPEQPLFVLASNDFTAGEAEHLLGYVRSNQGAEPKFSRIKRSAEGVRGLIRFLSDPTLKEDRIVTDVYHKRFMVMAKLVDLIEETLVHEVGGDLYERGGNIAMANLLFYCLPVFCGTELTDSFLQAFVALVRGRSDEDAKKFYAIGRRLRAGSKNEKFKAQLDLLTEERYFKSWFTDEINSTSLDPAIPALFQHLVAWGSRRKMEFDVMHDRSKPVLASQADFEAMMAVAGDQIRSIGRDRRTIEFPLRARTLTQANSQDHPQLQIADLCAGLTNHMYRCMVDGQFDELGEAAKSLGCVEWAVNGLFPEPKVTPEALGTADTTGSNSIEEMSKYLFEKRFKNRK